MPICVFLPLLAKTTERQAKGHRSMLPGVNVGCNVFVEGKHLSIQLKNQQRV